MVWSKQRPHCVERAAIVEGTGEHMGRLRVGIDAHALGHQLDGTQMYVRNLIRALARVDPEGDYSLVLPPSAPAISGAEKMQRVVLHHTVGPIRIPLASSWAGLRAGFDVFHVQFAAPLFCPARIVVTIHDIMFEHHPDYYAPADLRQLRLRVPRTVQRAAAILTGSEYSKQDIVRRFHIPAEKVTVAQYAPDPMFRPLADRDARAAVRETYRTGERFILFAGALKPNKNLKTLVAAYVSLRQSGTVAHPLVLAGTRNLLDQDVFAPARAAGLGEALVFTGHVPDDDLVALYNAADVFVQPSIFEGFGLPALEAMACGTPVITSTTTSIPEVVGDAASLVDPLDVQGLAQAMAAGLGDEALRRDLSARGLERAAKFSWDACARTIAAVYRSAARSPQ